jgi:lipopolysaccharide/colanic/teichoic acid biosynthesis glycosyltransferase
MTRTSPADDITEIVTQGTAEPREQAVAHGGRPATAAGGIEARTRLGAELPAPPEHGAPARSGDGEPPVVLLSGAAQGTYVRTVKPVFDRVVAALLLVGLAPVIAALAVAVKLSMGRPVLFKQQRVGLGGELFTLWKFRTMLPDRRTSTAPYDGPERRLRHKTEHDPRVTPVGAFLRKWSLDEIPQLVNVVAGDMSLVGPRPELPHIVHGYADWQHQRHAVRPGLTGLWQISERGNRPLHECTERDLEYLDTVSYGTDLRILARTPLAAMGSTRGF